MNDEKLTDKDVEAMLAEIGFDTEGEREFLESELPTVTKELNKLRAAWRIQKALREDERMQAVYKDYIKLKKAREYMEARLIELSGTPES